MSELDLTDFEVIINVPYTEQVHKFTANLLYGQLLNCINEYVYNYKKYYGKSLVFDFSNVKQVEPIVLANLVTLGLGLNKCHRSITIIRNAKGEVANFFSASGFKSLVEKENIYIFENFEMFDNGNWANKIANSRMFLHYFKFPEKFNDYTESDFENFPNISQKVVEYLVEQLDEYDNRFKINEILNDELAITDSEFKDLAESLNNPVINTIMPLGRERMVQTGVIFKCILENIKNAFMHGLKGCVIIVFTESLKAKKKEKISIAVSDIGNGITESMKKKKGLLFDERKILAFNSRNDLSENEKIEYSNNYRYILECIFYRARKYSGTNKYKTFGIFDIICSLLDDNDKDTRAERRVYLHSDKVRLCLTNRFYDTYLKKCKDQKSGDINVSDAADILSKEVYSFNDDFSYIKLTKKFGGAHFEYEFFVDEK